MKAIISLIIAALMLTSLASALTINYVSTTPSQVEPGKTATISLGIKNNLDEDIENVGISLDLENLPIAPYKESTEKTIDEIEEDKTKYLEFEIIVLSEASSGTYKIPVSINYNETQKTSYISLIVNAQPSLELDYEGTLIKGGNNELTLRIINSGLEDVKLLSIAVDDGSGLKFLSSKYVYIGDVDSDDFETVEFDVFIRENAGSTIELPVQFSYRDSLNKVYEESRSVVIKIYTVDEAVSVGLIAKSNTMTYVGWIIGIIVIYILYRIIRKRRR